jgi:sodium/bile acid cotransporter 7
MEGVPMAGVLFCPAVAGVVMLPLMFFHQIQLIVCDQIARIMGERSTAEEAKEEEETDSGRGA